MYEGFKNSPMGEKWRNGAARISATVAEVSLKMNRKYIGFDVNQKYIAMTEKRLKQAFPNKNINEFSK